MKKVFSLIATAILAVGFTACSQSDLLEGNGFSSSATSNDNAIQFDTYMSKVGTTRTGSTGSINTDKLKTSDYGFGVFSYYTGKETYGHYQSTTYTGEEATVGNRANHIANFMFNQKVTWNTDDWTYSPIKYWPNEVQTGAVDDQNGNTSNDPATSSSYENGGNLTFFAYAPYVAFPLDGTGIIAINDQTTLDAANSVTGDPKITYKIAVNGQTVDLLWGTYWKTSENVVSEVANNLGVAYDADAAADTYKKAILPHYTNNAKTTYDGYKLNADLTKQKTTGKVGFNFKHALAKVGGSQVNPGAGSNPTNGLMVVLDIDKDGAEAGGTKDANTVVTIEKITITSKEVKYDSDGDGDIDGDDTPAFVDGGVFNLATGKWESYTTGTAITHNITNADAVTTDGNNDALLATSIAEPNTGVTSMSPVSTIYQVNGSVEGVTTTAKNVYKDEANPFVFIPGTIPSFNVTVTYIVRSYDGNLADAASGGEGSWTKVKQVISKDVSLTSPVELNKQYNLLMHLGLTSVKFTATVSDWAIDGDVNGDGTISGGEAVNINDVYVPINVSELTAVKLQDGTGADLATTINSESTTLTLGKVFLDYSDNNDDKTVALGDFATESVIIEPAAGLTYNSSTGDITFAANETTTARTYTFTVKRGNTLTGNLQSATYTFTQKAPTLTAVTIAGTSVSTAGDASFAPQVNATYTHTGGGTFTKNDVSPVTYSKTVDGSYTSSLNIPAGSDGETFVIYAQYNDGVTNLKSGETTITYTAP